MWITAFRLCTVEPQATRRTNIRFLHVVAVSSLLTVASLLSGCSSWSFWPFGPAKTAHETGVAPVRPSDTPFSAQRKQDPAGAVQVVDIAFDVMRIELPVGGVRDARKIWNHVDEVRVNPDQAALLARNGLRVGAASPSAWPAIQTILDAAGAKVTSEHLFPQRGAPLPVRLGQVQDDESVFCYGRDGRLAGKTFPAGDKVMLIDYALHPELDGCIDLGVNFEIAHDNGQTVWEQRDGVLQQAPAYERHRFDDLTALLTLHPGEFLIVGQCEEIKNEYVVGSRFLSARRAGERYETLIFLAPQPYQTQTARRSPS
jgi:hypothetical protein